jgi:hypothetical protein
VKVLSSTVLAEERGTLSFTTSSDSRHDLCVGVGISSGEKPIVFEMQLQRGHSSGYYEEMAAKEHLDRLELEVG